MSLRIALFYHSLVSDWNHGNAHFLRGIAAELIARGHDVQVFEPENGWSRENLLREHGTRALEEFRGVFPGLQSHSYRNAELRLDDWLDGVDLAIVHEWNEPELVAQIGRYRAQHSALRVLFHDTHHRASTATEELARFDLENYDGVLAYGASLKRAYQRLGWGRQVHVWHEAADTRVFYPREFEGQRRDVVWIGNWGDEERIGDSEIISSSRFAKAVAGRCMAFVIPDFALRELSEAGIITRGWLPNYEVPEVFSRFHATVHVPRGPMSATVAGIPTIRPFEALACGIPLDFGAMERYGGIVSRRQDFLMAKDGRQMERCLRDV